MSEDGQRLLLFISNNDRNNPLQKEQYIQILC